jgi:flagellar assembly factor FliW
VIEVELITSRFGKIEVNEEDVLTFHKGLLGFEQLTQFILLPIAEAPSFMWLQAVEDTDISLLLVDPFVFKKDYEVELDEIVLQSLGIEFPEQVLICTVVTVATDDIKDATTNLMGPIVMNTVEKLGQQIIVDDKQYKLKHPLFSVQTASSK